MSDLNRRQFVFVAAATCAACALQSSRALFAAEKVEPVDVGELTDFGKDGIYDQFAKEHKFFLIRKGDRLYATAAMCTHKNFMVAADSESKKELKCTKHGSRFDNEGIVLKGPAKDALPRYAIKLDERKHVIVDPNKPYAQKQWKDAGSFIKVAKSAG